MKSINNIIIGFCTLLAFASKAQNPLFFDKYYKTGYNNVLSTSIIKINDSIYNILNYTKDSITGQQNPTIIKIDKYGNQILNKTYNFNSDYLAYSNGARHFINATPCSHFLTAATYPSAFTTIVINKINKTTLDTITNTYYNDGIYNYYLSSILKIHTNKFFLVGNKSDATSTWPVFIEIDSNAVVKNTITVTGTQSLSTTSAYYDTISKKIVFSGWKYGSTNYFSFVALADTLGNIIKTFTNSTYPNNVNKILFNIIDNSYITIGSKTTSIYGTTNMYRMHITKYDAALNILWQKTYGKANMINIFRDAIINVDGSVILVGSYSDSVYLPIKNVNTNAVMLKINANGDSLWMREFDHINNTTSWNNTYEEAFSGIEKTPEDGYIMCGNAQQQPKAQAWVVKTDSMGCVLSNCSTTNINELNATIKELNVYPNPATNILNIEYNLLGETIKDIKLINSLGNTVLTTFEFVDKKTAIMDINNLMSGVYSISISNQNNTIITKKIVVIK